MGWRVLRVQLGSVAAGYLSNPTAFLFGAVVVIITLSVPVAIQGENLT